ncbi:MAG: hypothetical protein J0M29_14110 [Chitinophagales bacterium]|nr:hypothetical protein [Chitinophagales bacterium]
MKYSFLFGLICSAMLGICGFCGNPQPESNATAPLGLVSAFGQASEAPDTLHFFISEAGDGPLISDSLLKAGMDSAQFEQLHFGTGDAQFRQLGRYNFIENLDALLIGTEEFWFGKQTLLFTDKKTGKLVGLVEVSHFYGGESGQTASESWWFRNANPPRLYTKLAEHGYRATDGEEPEEYHSEEGILLEWQKGAFQRIPQPDSLGALQKFSMYRVW